MEIMDKLSVNKPSSKAFVYKIIRYSDKNIIERLHSFEEVNRRKKLNENAKRVAYLSVFI